MVIIIMNLPETRKCRRGLFPAAYFAATAILLLPSYSHGQGQGQMGQGQMGQGQMGQGQPGQGRLGMAGNAPQTGEGGWRIRPRMSILETYTDNVTFARDDLKKSDFITQINPGLAITGVGRRFNFTGEYMMNNLIYADQSSFTRTRHQLNANATAELIENLLFVDGRALMTQQNITLVGPQAIDNVNVTGNRADVRNFSVSPYIRHRFQDFATTELRYTRNVTSSSANPLRNSQADAFQAGLTSGTAFTAFNWGLNYSNQTVHFDGTSRTVELERSIASVGYRVTPQFGVTATGGYERNSFISIRGNPSSPTWTVGFSWMPSERTSIVASAGQRFFGPTYSLLASHRTRLTMWDASYTQNITTFNQQAGGAGSSAILGGSLNQLLAAQNPSLSPEFIQQNSNALTGLGLTGSFFSPTNFLTNQVFLQKTLQASVAMNGIRNTAVFRVFDMTRQAYTQDLADIAIVGAENLALLNHTRQSGINALWSYRISEQTRANLNLGITRFSFLSTTRVDDLKMISLSLTRQLPQVRPNLSTMLQIRHNQRDSNQPGGEYRENAIIASLNMTF
jgi:uncharacterized protein (PEP-CTERM system associated)